MSLVAYESSDGSESEEEEQIQKTSVSLNDSQNCVLNLNTDACNSTTNTGLFSKLPPPKRPSTSPIQILNEDSIPNKILRKEPVKIVLPSLREFEDDEEEEKSKKDKKKPSMFGSGLIGMLPEPQHMSMKTSFQKLIPLAVTRKPAPTQTAKPLPSPNLSKPSPVKTADPKPEDDRNSDDENITDYFSLTKTAVKETDKSALPVEGNVEPTVDSAFNKQKLDFVGTCLNEMPLSNIEYGKNLANNMNVNFPAVEYANAVSSEDPSYGPAYPTDESANWEWNVQPSPSSAPDVLENEALMRLAGKKQSSRENIQLLEVKGDDLVAGRDEWLLKSLSEENGYQSVSKKSDQPSAMHRRKHQITYLAFQAKAREQELKNQWAMNRMTKRQTQSKYGF